MKSEYEIKSYVEFSGGGVDNDNKRYHVWVFIKPTESIKVQNFGEYVCSKVGFENGEIEIFPKNDDLTKLDKGVGNLVKLPLGINLKTDERSKFVSSKSYKPVKSLKLLKSISPIDLPNGDFNIVKSDIKQEEQVITAPNDKDKSKFERNLAKLKFCINYVYYTGVELCGAAGDNFRLHVAWDIISNKSLSENMVYEYFKKQGDYDRDIIMNKIKQTHKKKSKLVASGTKSVNKLTRCSKMKSKCGLIVNPICKLCDEAKEIKDRASHGEKFESIFKDLNLRELKPIWEDIKQSGIKGDRGTYFEVPIDKLDEIIKYYNRDSKVCRLKWRNAGLIIFKDGKTSIPSRVSGKLSRVIRFDTKAVEEYLGK